MVCVNQNEPKLLHLLESLYQAEEALEIKKMQAYDRASASLAA
jgi:hypothetical protein